MRTSRRLSLTREVLSELTPHELSSVVGGSHTCPITDACTHTIPSYDQSCPTVPLQCITETCTRE